MKPECWAQEFDSVVLGGVSGGVGPENVHR